LPVRFRRLLMSHSMRRLASILFLVIGGLSITACSQPPPSEAPYEDAWGIVEIRPARPLYIGVVTSTYDPGLAQESLEITRGVELAIQRRIHIRGFIVQTEVVNTYCSETGGLLAAQIFTNHPYVVSAIGHVCSLSCLTGASLYDEAFYTTISPSCSATSLTDQVTHNDSFMRTIYRDSAEAETAARYAYIEMGARRAALVHDGTIDTSELIAAFQTTFEHLGGTIVAIETITPGGDNFQAQLEAIGDANPNVIYAPLLPSDAITLVKQRIDLGLSRIPLIGGRHYWSTWFAEQVKGYGEGVYAVGPILDNEAYNSLTAAYISEYGEEPSNPLFAYSYDATVMLLQAIEKVAIVTPSGYLQIGRRALREALYSTSTFPGLTGTLTCTNWGDCSATTLAVGQIQFSEWRTIYIP
jgi:branched-chain amino acid transport system substrate-binding protein